MILLAGEEQTLMQDIQNRLAREGFQVRLADNGRQAYDVALKCLPDLVITDAVLSGMNGFEFSKSLKADPHFRHTPIIVLSAKASIADSFRYLGIEDFFVKPLDLDALQQRVRMRLASLKANSKTKVIMHCCQAHTISMVKELFEREPHWEPVYAYTGEDLLKKAQEFIPQVILVDLLMTDKPPDEVVAKLKDLPELTSTVILTYYSPISAAQESFALQARMIEIQYLKRVCAEAGAREYLGPFNPSNFLGLFQEYRKDLIPSPTIVLN